MTRSYLPKFARVLAVAVISMIAFGGAAPDPVHPPAPGGNLNAPVQIALLADHYTSKQEFTYDVENFIKYGLLEDPYYKSKKGNIRIVSYYDATPPGVDSRFGFEIGTGDGNCSVKAPADILDRLTTAAPEFATHYIVIANHPYNIGCTVGNWTYVAVDAVGTDVLQHELGHLIGQLYDEWGFKNSGAHQGTPVGDTLNCSDAQTPYWMSNQTAFPGANTYPGCDLYESGASHAYNMCRMGAMYHKEFCLVCKAVMDKAFAFMTSAQGSYAMPQPQASHEPTTVPRFRITNASFVQSVIAQDPAQQNLPRRIMRLMVDFDPGSGPPTNTQPSLRVRPTRIYTNGVYVPKYRRVGRFVYEVTDTGDRLKEIGVIPDSMFRSRAYHGSAGHATGAARPVQMFVDIPDEDNSTMTTGNRQLKIALYRLPDTFKDEMITKASWPKVKDTYKPVRIGEPVPIPVAQPK